MMKRILSILVSSFLILAAIGTASANSSQPQNTNGKRFFYQQDGPRITMAPGDRRPFPLAVKADRPALPGDAPPAPALGDPGHQPYGSSDGAPDSGWTNSANFAGALRGDVLVYRSSSFNVYGSISWWSHSGLAKGNGYTVESLTDPGVTSRDITVWNKTYAGAVLYYPIYSTADFATTIAESFIGTPYNWLFNDKWRIDQFYCSQLVWMSFKNTQSNWSGPDLDYNGGNMVSPDDVWYSSNLTLWSYSSN